MNDKGLGTHARAFRVSSFLATSALFMSFYLAGWKDQPEAFVVVAPIAVGGKWLENSVERWRERRTRDLPE